MKSKENRDNFSQNDIKKTYEKLGEKYLENIEKYTPKAIYDFMKLLPKGGTVLDVGSAGGRDSEKFSQSGFKVIGIDLVDKFIKTAQNRVPSGTFRKMDLEKLDFPKNYFDGIWVNAVLMHVRKKNIQKVLDNLNQCLKPNGKAYFQVKKGIGEQYLTDKFSPIKKRFVSLFEKKEFEEDLKKSGYHLLKTSIKPDNAGRPGIDWIEITAEKKI